MYDLILRIDLPTFDMLVARGLFPCTIKRDREIYEAYLIEIKSVGKMQALANLSEKYKLTERMIYNIVKKMR